MSTSTERHPTSKSIASPPAETGRRLATIERAGRPGERSELRVSLDSFKGHDYLSIRVWQESRDGSGFWPVRGKGVSVRLSEAEAVADALLTGLDLAEVGCTSGAGEALGPKLYQPADGGTDGDRT